ncbi:MAG: PEP-CTERM sorting domain-containing protein [Oscillatoria sp. PMC 1068.18]|nr:PEP-CTERM sorting domain-containing protein [Oscillatoria sp. PMC 1076.18]MEC4988033.1 PEP-CTERM sorting domain-containing protein [Oscillatoria sp. PMC 1068.18]
MNNQSILKIAFTTASFVVVASFYIPTAAFALIPDPVDVTNTVDALVEATVDGDINAVVEETTETDVGNLGGASTDSQTEAQVNDLHDADLSSLTDLDNLINTDGELNVTAEVDEDGIQVDADADLGVAVGDLAEVGICLDASASVGSPDGSSLADCSEEPPVQSVPEPTAIASLLLLGGFFLARRHRDPQTAEAQR